MRKSISLISAACFMMLANMPLNAQDARQRKPETIVQDVLAPVSYTHLTLPTILLV